MENTKNINKSPTDYPNGVKLFVVVLGLVLVYIIIDTIRLRNTGFEEQTLWDWMGLLIVPLLIPLSLFILNRGLRESERRITIFNAQRDRLQAYFDRITDLMLQHDLDSNPKPVVKSIARTLTLSVTPGLNDVQKGQILVFLHETELILQPAVISLRKADFNDALLPRKVDLRRIFLREAELNRAQFEKAILYLADLRESLLISSNFNEAIMVQARLRDAILENAQMQKAVLKDIDFRGAVLRGVTFDESDLTDADFRRSDLRGASFTQAVLINNNFEDALFSVDQLSDAKEVKDVILPDGTLYSRKKS